MGAAQGQPPTGPSPASHPTPNAGNQTAGLVKLSIIVNMMPDIIKDLGVTTEAGLAAAKAMQDLAKHVPEGSVSAGMQNSQLQKTMLQNRQNGAQMQAMRAAAPAGAGAPPDASPQPAAA